MFCLQIFSGFGRRKTQSKQRGTSSKQRGNSSKQSQEELWSVDTVKQTFSEFFKRKGFDILEPSPVIPQYDQAIKFPNDGMNPIFSGNAHSSDSRACNLQKVLRTQSSKHHLSDIGKNTYQHTYFQTLGMWQFEGHYFKEDAIKLVWELLTKVYNLEETQIYVTYFRGEAQHQLQSSEVHKLVSLPCDVRTKSAWDGLLPSQHVVALGANENFWEMGEVGPCGPCSKIYYNRGHAKLVANMEDSDFANMEDCDFVEMANLVFLEYERGKNGVLTKLLHDHVDMGMGLERLTATLQGKLDNYKTPIFTPIIEAIRMETKARRYLGNVGSEDPDYIDTAYRVIADHVRGICFAIADGTNPGLHSLSGHVLKTILDRAVSYGRDFLGAKEGFLSRLVCNLIPSVFPELARYKDEIMKKVVEAEKQVTKISLDEIEEAVKLYNYLKGVRRKELIDDLFDEFYLPKSTFANHLRLTLEEIIQKSITTQQLPSLVRAFTSFVRGFFTSDVTSRIPLEFQFFLDFLDENCCNKVSMKNAVNHPILLNKEQRILYRSEVQLMCEDVGDSEYDRLFFIRALLYVIRGRNASSHWIRTVNQRHPPCNSKNWIQDALYPDEFRDKVEYTDDAMSFVRFCRNINIHKFPTCQRDTMEGELTLIWPGFLSLLHEAAIMCGVHINKRPKNSRSFRRIQ